MIGKLLIKRVAKEIRDENRQMSPPPPATTLSANVPPNRYPFLTRLEFEISAKSFVEQSRKAEGTEAWSWVEHEVNYFKK